MKTFLTPSTFCPGALFSRQPSMRCAHNKKDENMVLSPLAGKEVEVSEVQLSLKDRQTRMSIGTTNCDIQIKREST
jgi:hypothetical protein